MRRIDGLAIKGGKSVVLKPGGYHMMLMDLKRPLKEGDLLKFTLTFEKAGDIEVEATVEPIGAKGPHGFDSQPVRTDKSAAQPQALSATCRRRRPWPWRSRRAGRQTPAPASCRPCSPRRRPWRRARCGSPGWPSGRPWPADPSAIGRRSPCASTRPMCSSGVALSQTTKQRREQQVVGGRLRHQAAAGGDHRALEALHDGLQALPLELGGTSPGPCVAKISDSSMPLARSISRSSSTKGTASASGGELAERRLAGAAQADQRDAARARARRLAEALGDQLARLGQLGRRQALQLVHGERQVDRPLRLVADQSGGLDAQRVARSGAAPAARHCRRRAPARPGSARTRPMPGTAPCATCPGAPAPAARARRRARR